MLSPAILADRRADPQNWPCNSTGFPEWRAGDCTCKVCTPIKTPSGAPPDIESPKYHSWMFTPPPFKRNGCRNLDLRPGASGLWCGRKLS